MTTRRATIERWARWVATFIGFPLAGMVARLAVGNIDAAGAAVVGGLAGGAVLGVIQVAVGGVDRTDRSRWVGATAAGLAVGLGLGAGAVGYRTDPASLAVMGAISGAAVGLAQALSIRMRLLDRIMWAVATPVLWAGGWLITSQVIVDADRQHAMFGIPSALTVCAIAGVLHVARRRTSEPSTRIVATTGPAVA